MNGAQCDHIYLIDSVLVTATTPSGIATRHVDSAYWPPYDHMDIMGYTVAGPCIATFLYNTFYRSFDYGGTWDTLELDALAPICFIGVDSVLFYYEYGAAIMCLYDYGTSWDSVPSPSPTCR